MLSLSNQNVTGNTEGLYNNQTYKYYWYILHLSVDFKKIVNYNKNMNNYFMD